MVFVSKISDHVDCIVTKSFKMLGFLLRITKCLKNVKTFNYRHNETLLGVD